MKKQQSSDRKLTVDTVSIRALESYGWPDNVRELQNTIERLMAFCQTETIRIADIAAVLEKWHVHPVKASFHSEEIREITDALTQAKEVQTAAAKLLGIDQTTLWRKIRRLGIQI